MKHTALKSEEKRFRPAGQLLIEISVYADRKVFKCKMSEESISKQTVRQGRVNRLKRLIVFALAAMILVPVFLCMVLFIRVSLLEQTMMQMKEQLDGIQYAMEELKLSRSQEAGEVQAVTGQPAIAPGSVMGTGEMGGMEEAAEGDREAAEEVSGGDALAAEDAAHKVYLTFDDGPSIYTEEILDILDRYDVKATFFVLGKEDDDSQEAIKEIVDRGHTLGMHSYSHKYSEIYQSVEDFAADFLKLQDYLYDLTGIRCQVYRFPGGSSNTVSSVDMHEFADYLETQDTRFFDWNISSQDASSKRLSVKKLVENTTTGISQRKSSMILMHDSADKRSTVEALPMIIENILAMEDTVILPITDDTEPIQHIQKKVNE